MTVETDQGFDEIIPWHFSSTHSETDKQKVLLIEDKTRLTFSINARRGWLTKAGKRVLADEEFDKKFKLKGKQTNNRYKDSLDNLEERMAVLVNGYRRYLQLFPLEVNTVMDEFNTSAETYWSSRDILDRLLDSTAEVVVSNRPPTNNAERDNIPKAATMLAPNQLTESSTPQAFGEWCDRLKIYMSANGLLKRPNDEQIQYARSFMSSQLFHLVRDKVTTNLPVFLEKDDATYLQNEMNCLIDILDKEFLRIHPTVTRRLELFKTKQMSHQSSLAFLSQLKRDSLAANLFELTEEQIICILLLNGLNNSTLRSDILDAFDIEEQLSITAIEHEIRKFEANRRTNNYVSGKSAELFKLSTYKKQKNNYRTAKANPNACGKCGKLGHVAQKCYSNQNRSRQRTKNRAPSFRPHSKAKRSFSRHPRTNNRTTNFRSSRSGSRSSSRGPRHYKKNGNVLRVLTQSDDYTLDTETDETGRFVSHCKMVKSNNTKKSMHQYILGFPRSLPTPKIQVKVTPLGPNDTRGNTFNYECVPDTGASKSVISAQCAQSWQLWLTSAAQESLINASNQPMKLIGCSNIEVTYKNTSLKVHVLVTPDVEGEDLLLSWHDLINLKIISLDVEAKPLKSCLKKVATPTSKSETADDAAFVPNDTLEKILSDFEDVVSDTMPMKPIRGYQMKIHLDPTKPIPKMPYIAGRNRPKALEKAAHEDIQNLLRLGIIRPADEATEFMHPGFHSLKPNGKLRFLVDYSQGVNKCIKRQVHPFIPGNQLLQRIRSDSAVFAVFDALNGYFQLELHPDSRKYTCFVVNEGRFFFNRASQGLSQSADSYVEATDRILSGLPGLEKLIDDIFLQAPDYITLFYRIRKFLLRCRQYNIGISRRKVQCGSSVSFCGHIVSDKGIMMDPNKLRALRDFRVPRDRTDTKSFLGLLQTFSTFYYEITAIRQPLNELTKKDVKFHWNDVLQKSFEECKSRLLSNKRILTPFDPKLDTYCYTDAARSGFGMAIIQYRNEDKTDVSLIMCASRSLTKCEINYGITDLEITCCAWAICKGSYFLRGLQHFFLMTDHKSTINIFEKPWATIVTPRQLRVRQKLVGYNFTPVFVAGSRNTLADAVSRAPVEPPTEEDILDSKECDAATNICNHIKENPNVINPMLNEMIQAAKEDSNYRDVIRMIRDGYKQEDIRKLKADNPAKVFAKDWNRIGILGDLLIFDGYRIIVPKVCRPKIMQILHEPVHGGITKTREAAKELYMWPSQGRQIAQMISSCERCIEKQASRREATFIPIPSSYPMERVACDPFYFEGKNFLATKDSFTGWAWCHKLKTLTTREVIEKLESIFLIFGKVKILQSDFGPCFRSQEMKDWLSKNGILQETSSSHHQSANGLIEVCIRDLKRCMAKNRGNWSLFLIALQDYNNLPRSDGVSASDLMFNRRQKTRLPALESAFTLREPHFDQNGKMTFFKNNKSHNIPRGSREKVSDKTSCKGSNFNLLQADRKSAIFRLDAVTHNDYEVQLCSQASSSPSHTFVERREANMDEGEDPPASPPPTKNIDNGSDVPLDLTTDKKPKRVITFNFSVDEDKVQMAKTNLSFLNEGLRAVVAARKVAEAAMVMKPPPPPPSQPSSVVRFWEPKNNPTLPPVDPGSIDDWPENFLDQKCVACEMKIVGMRCTCSKIAETLPVKKRRSVTFTSSSPSTSKLVKPIPTYSLGFPQRAAAASTSTNYPIVSYTSTAATEKPNYEIFRPHNYNQSELEITPLDSNVVPPLHLRRKKSDPTVSSARAHSIVARCADPSRPVKNCELKESQGLWRREMKKKRLCKAADKYFLDNPNVTVTQFHKGDEVMFKTGETQDYNEVGVVEEELYHYNTKPENQSYLIRKNNTDLTCIRTGKHIILRKKIDNFIKQKNYLFSFPCRHSHHQPSDQSFTSNRCFISNDEEFYCMTENGLQVCDENETILQDYLDGRTTTDRCFIHPSTLHNHVRLMGLYAKEKLQREREELGRKIAAGRRPSKFAAGAQPKRFKKH